MFFSRSQFQGAIHDDIRSVRQREGLLISGVREHRAVNAGMWGLGLYTDSLVSSRTEVLNPGGTSWVVISTYMGQKAFNQVSWTPGSC